MIMVRAKRKHGFTLAEMIMAVALLAFFSVFIVQMFAKAELLSRQSEQLDLAVIRASELADQWKRQGTEGIMPEILVLRDERWAGHRQLIHLDSQLKPGRQDESIFTAVLTLTAAEDEQSAAFADSFELWVLTIEIVRDVDADQMHVYTLQTGQYFAKAGDG